MIDPNVINTLKLNKLLLFIAFYGSQVAIEASPRQAARNLHPVDRRIDLNDAG